MSSVERRSGIEWTGFTWNPWQGCKKVSSGCLNCYMFREKKYYGQDPTTIVRSKKPTFNKPLRLTDPSLIFTCSWSDFFLEEADEWRSEAWDIIRRTPHHTYQILTKRPERIKECLPEDWGEGWDNVWLGVTVENQDNIDRARILILNVKAKLRFISAEPLIGDVDLKVQVVDGSPGIGPLVIEFIDWVIVGGESGPGCRAMDPAWASDLRDQCQEEGVAYFLKQLGGHPNKRAGDQAILDGIRIVEYPARQTGDVSVDDFF